MNRPFRTGLLLVGGLAAAALAAPALTGAGLLDEPNATALGERLLPPAAGRWLGYPVGGWGALLVPLVIALQLPMLAGLALGLAALNAHFKDVRDLLGNLLTLLFFLAPILYPLAAVPLPALRTLVRFNPFTPFTLAWQATLFEGAVPPAAVWLHMAAVALVAWAAGAALFGRLRETLVEAV